MKWVGVHVQTSGGVQTAPLNAHRFGARAFGMFTKNPRQWLAKPLDDRNIAEFKTNCARFGYTPERILPHDSYLINPGHPDAQALCKSRAALLDEFRRCELLGLICLNFHPGSHLGGISESRSLSLVAESINLVLSQTRGVTAVIENTAGQGSDLGYRFEHLAEIIDQVEDHSRVGVCLDTCHSHAAGYDLRSAVAWAAFLAEFDRVVGLNFLKAMHLNDCRKSLGSRVDRHASIDQGVLGSMPFEYIMKDIRLEDMPLILETPDETFWTEEIKLLYKLQGR